MLVMGLNDKLESVIILLVRCYHVLNTDMMFICVKFKSYEY
jgi:hypothetical protein